MIAICIIGVDEWIIQGFQSICIKKPSCSDDDTNGSGNFTRNEANVFFPIQPVIYINSQKLGIANFINGMPFYADSYIWLGLFDWCK